jgi:hypothetical protein
MTPEKDMRRTSMLFGAPQDQSAFWQRQRDMAHGRIEDATVTPPRRLWLLAIPAAGLVLIVLSVWV